jgi:DMSO reductase family type II enzyme chaperone
MAVNATERAFARANLYRFLSLAFSYPMAAVHAELLDGIEAASLASSLISSDLERLMGETADSLPHQDRRDLAADFRRTFTLSGSPDCPLNECAYSAKHVYQEVGELADLAGFYRAFGLEITGERPDALSAELEFCGMLALKEGLARERADREQTAVCVEAYRHFLHDHLGRWAENIGRRVEILAAGSIYAGFGRLLYAFARAEIERVRPGPISPFQEVPNPPEPIDDEGCPAEEGLGTVAYSLQSEDFIGTLTQVEPALAEGGS